MAQLRLVRAHRTILLVLLALAPCMVVAGYSVDEDPREVNLDPGDVWLPGPLCEIDDGDGSCPPPSLAVPNPGAFDLDAFAVEEPVQVCPTGVPFTPGILFSLDDADPGPGSGPPDNATEIFFYDHCLVLGAQRRSYLTSITEGVLGLLGDPPPRAEDDDVDAYETRSALAAWGQGIPLLFSPDNPSNGGFGPGSEGNIYFMHSTMLPPPGIWATPATLGVPDTDSCDIDGIAPFFEPALPWQILFTTDLNQPCGLDPGDIYASDNAGNFVLYADDVNDMRIAVSEMDEVDIDALAVNTGGNFDIGDPFDPPDSTFYKADWQNYAPSGMPDFSQDHAGPGWTATWCGPTAVADSFWWFDSEMECGRDRTPGDPAETEVNDFCDLSDRLGEVPPATGGLGFAADVDWYTFSIPYRSRAELCTVTVSTCAMGNPGDADTFMRLYDDCIGSGPGTPVNLIAANDDGCPDAFRQQSEITVQLASGDSYWVEVSQGPIGGPGLDYTLSLGIDCYPLVERYPETPDDHHERNVDPLIRDLSACMNTDDVAGSGAWRGTRLSDVQACIDQWLINKGLDTEFFRQTVLAPTFEEVEDEVERSEDVILLLGFYWSPDLVNWFRCGGHYVTVAGVDSPNQAIVFSDPALNNAEPPPAGNGAPGRVRGLTHIDHAPAVNPPPDHDDTVNVSHDRYTGAPSNTPNASWAVPNYGTAGGPTTCTDVARWCMSSDWGQNPADTSQPQSPCILGGTRVSAEVEAMVDVSPEQTAVCAYLVTDDVWPANLRVRKGTCAPAATGPAYDVIRGKLCNLQLTPVPLSDLGHVVCLYNDVQIDEFDDLSPDDTDCFGAWFYLVRESTDPDYGQAYPGGEPRLPTSGGCP